MNKSENSDLYYRRGAILGMTFAEILILLLFLLLLILGSKIISLDSDKKNRDKETNVISLIKEKNSEHFDIIADLVENQKSEEAYKLLIESSPEVQEIKNKILQYETEFKEISNKISQYEANIEQSSNIIKTCKAQNSFLVKQNGLTLPPCWADQEGKPQYIYNIILKNDGIWVIDNKIQSRAEDQKQLPLQDFNLNLAMQPGDFMKAGKGLKAYGNKNECRFYVKIYDQTDANRKEHYKLLKRSVEDVFYKLEVK